MKNFKVIFILLITAISLQPSLFSMYGEEEAADELAPLLGVEKKYQYSESLVRAFHLTDKKIINFLHAVEDGANIDSYLKNPAIIGSWRVIGIARDIAKKTNRTNLVNQLSTILKQRYGVD